MIKLKVDYVGKSNNIAKIKVAYNLFISVDLSNVEDKEEAIGKINSTLAYSVFEASLKPIRESIFLNGTVCPLYMNIDGRNDIRLLTPCNVVDLFIVANQCYRFWMQTTHCTGNSILKPILELVIARRIVSLVLRKTIDRKKFGIDNLLKLEACRTFPIPYEMFKLYNL